MEDLNNRQMILLSMFVSFVVSIATGIITVAMLEEAPQTVTQTVNRVVERTIERVVPGETTPNKTAPVTTTIKEVTVFAKEDDLLVAAVEKNLSRMVKIWDVGATTTPPRAIGFVVSRDGLIVTEAKALFGDDTPKDSYIVGIGDNEFIATPMHSDDSALIAFMKITNLPEGATLDAVTFGSNILPKLAQTIVVLGGEDGTAVIKTSIARVRSVRPDVATSSPDIPVAFEVAPQLPDGNAGGLAVNLDGQAVGIVVGSGLSESYSIYPAVRILKDLGSVNASPAEQSSVAEKVQSGP